MHTVRRIREDQRLTYVELSGRLTDVGRPIPVLGLRRIERGERRVDVDDLLALATALRVAPIDLLVPAVLADGEAYDVGPGMTTTAGRARDWLCGTGFLKDPDSPAEFAEAIRFMPKTRAEEMARRWFRSEVAPGVSRESEWNRQTLAWETAQKSEDSEAGEK
jgi:transcriptional regulator with XRE-family HTH domain